MKNIMNYQILQRDADGWADAPVGGKVPAEMTEKHSIHACAFRETDNLMVASWQQAQIKDDEWSVTLRLPEGGPYRIEACLHNGTEHLEWSKRILCVRHVGVGDLYILAGQSNMAGYGRDAAFDPPSMGVHLYANNGKWDIAAHPLNDPTDTIYPETAEYNSGTSPALAFGRRLREELGIPIGLVQASLGGSTLDRWTPAEEGSLYRCMLRRLAVVGKVKGVLWYQGCSDAKPGLAEKYQERFTTMVKLWRQEIGDVPFLTVQLNRWGESPEGIERYWGMVKEAQRRVAMELPGVYVVPSYDVTMSDGIHNSAVGNVTLGERLARVALQKIYSKPGLSSPNIEKVEYVDETHIRLHFQADSRIWPTDRRADGMHVEDAQGLVDAVFAQEEPDAMVITLERPITLPAVFHAYWQHNVPAFLAHDVHGMPMLACYGVPIEV